MIRSLGKVYRKEMAGLWVQFAVTAVVLVLFRTVTWFWLQPSMTSLDVIYIGVGIPLLLLVPWGVLRGAGALSVEWNRDTSHLLFSLPVSRLTLVLAKVFAVLTELSGYVCILLLSILITPAPVAEALGPALDAGFRPLQMVTIALVLAVIYLLALACVVSLGQLLAVASRLVGRRMILPVGITVSAVWLWLMLRVNSLLVDVFPRLGGPRIAVWYHDRGLVRVAELVVAVAPLITALLLGAATLGLSAWVLERADVS